MYVGRYVEISRACLLRGHFVVGAVGGCCTAGKLCSGGLSQCVCCWLVFRATCTCLPNSLHFPEHPCNKHHTGSECMLSPPSTISTQHGLAFQVSKNPARVAICGTKVDSYM